MSTSRAQILKAAAFGVRLRGRDCLYLRCPECSHSLVGIEIRRIRADEWPLWRDARLRMLRQEAQYFSTRYEDVVREPDSTWSTWVAEGAAGIDKVLFVAEDGDGWMGVVGGFGRLDRSEVQLISLWVDRRARGRGAARALIRAVAGWARERGADRVVLFVQEANTPGRALYASAGFLPTGDRAPVGAGRPGFKLVLAAPVDSLLG